MSKDLKLYTPIRLGKNSSQVTFIRVDKCSSVKSSLPTAKEIGEHIYYQSIKVKQGLGMTPIKVLLDSPKWDELIRELSRKVGVDIRRIPVIDIILEQDQLPIIQIQKNKEA